MEKILPKTSGVKAVRLRNGVELIGEKVTQDPNLPGGWIFHRPMTVDYRHDPQSGLTVGLGPYTLIAEGGVIIRKDALETEPYTVAAEFEKAYLQQVTGIAL